MLIRLENDTYIHLKQVGYTVQKTHIQNLIHTFSYIQYIVYNISQECHLYTDKKMYV
jgi:hypothetical protein